MLGGGRRQQQGAGGLGGTEEAAWAQRGVLGHRPVDGGVLRRGTEPDHGPAAVRQGLDQVQAGQRVDRRGGGAAGGVVPQAGGGEVEGDIGVGLADGRGQRPGIGQIHGKLSSGERSGRRTRPYRPDHVPAVGCEPGAQVAADEAAGPEHESPAHTRAGTRVGATAATSSARSAKI